MPPRIEILAPTALLALVAGAFFALPAEQRAHMKVEVKNIPLLVELVSDTRARVEGLSGRDFLPEFGGMLFEFEEPSYHAIWMKGMRFPIDIFWIHNGRVVDMAEKAPIPSKDGGSPLPFYVPDVPAEFVLETRAGFASKYGIRIGDEVKIFQRGASLDAVSLKPAPETPGREYFIETLRDKPARGRNFKIERLLASGDVYPALLEKGGVYQKYLISYESDDLKLTGTMNIPGGSSPEKGFPVLILNHGLIHPDIYFPGRGSKREQDFFARRGYVTIHPDYRGYGPYQKEYICPPTLAWTREGCRHDFYQGYTDDVLNLIDALKRLNPKLFDMSRLGMWGHSMGGGIAARAAALSPDIRAYVLFAPISADAEDNFYELSPEERGRLGEEYGAGEAARKIYDQISPLSYFARVQAPIQLHHGAADRDVPMEFSQKMFFELRKHGQRAEYFSYAGEGHEFGDGWSIAAERALQFFNKYVKEESR